MRREDSIGGKGTETSNPQQRTPDIQWGKTARGGAEAVGLAVSAAAEAPQAPSATRASPLRAADARVIFWRGGRSA